MQYGALNMLYAFMSGLVCLHVFWFYLMVAGFVRRYFSGKGLMHGIVIVGNVNRAT
jgi:hypothetical protein